MSAFTSVYQFKISLIGSRPVIWRRVQFPTDITFHDLHNIINDSMGWAGTYSYSFTVQTPVAGEKISICCNPEFAREGLLRICAKASKVADYFSIENKKVLYEYCGYEGWRFDIIFQKLTMVGSQIQLPRCLTGKRAAPEEITKYRSGIQLHQKILKYIKQVGHPDYAERMEEIKEIYEDGFHPEVFDAVDVTFGNGCGMFEMILNRCNC